MQIVLFLILILAILIIFVSKKDTLSTGVKIYILVSLVIVIGAGWFYNLNSQNSAQHDRNIVNAFEQGKDIKCGIYTVNSKNFIFVSGTLSFVTNGNTENLKGVVLDISTCKLIHE